MSSRHQLFFNRATLSFDIGISENRLKEFEEGNPAINMRLHMLNYTANIKSKQDDKPLHYFFGQQRVFKTNDNFGEETLIPNSSEKEYGFFGITHYDISNVLYGKEGSVLIKRPYLQL